MTTQTEAVDVLAVMDVCEDLARHRLLTKRCDFDKMVADGKSANITVVVKTERADHLREQICEARAAVAELIEAAGQAECGCSLRERESGHRVGCWMPDLTAALAHVDGAA